MVDRVAPSRAASVASAQTSAQSPVGVGKSELPEKMVGLAKAQHSVQAQAKTVRAQNEILGTILDIKA